MKSSNFSRKSDRSFHRMLAMFAVAACVGLSAVPAHAHVPVDMISTSSQLIRCSGPLGHIYLYEPGGPVDVTSSYYVQNGQQYVQYNGNNIAITINYTNDDVYNMSDRAIGYYVPNS